MAASVGTVSTVAGSAEKGFEDGRGINAKFNSPLGLAFSKDGGILIADYMNHCIRKVVLAGSAPAHVETFAGIPGQYGHRDGDASQALFHFPSSIAVASDGTVYVADPGNKRTRKIDDSLVVTTLAGSIRGRMLDGKGDQACFSRLRDITYAKSQGGFYASDANSIRHVTEDGTVSTVAGLSKKPGHQNGDRRLASFNTPYQLDCKYSGQVYVADYDNHAIRAVGSDNKVITIAGGGQSGYEDGALGTSKFHHPVGVAINEIDQIFIGDCFNHRIRAIVSRDGAPVVTTLAGTGEVGLRDGSARDATLSFPRHLLIDSSTNSLYFTQNHCLRKLSLPRTPFPELEHTLLQDISSLVDNQRLSDVVFKINGKPIFASKNLLRLRSDYFDRMFSSGMKESLQNTEGIIEVPIQDVEFESFKDLIVYLMSDRLTFKPNDYKRLCQLLAVSDQFMVDRLKAHCERLLERQIQADNVFELVQVADTHGAEGLRDGALRYISQYKQMLKRDELSQLPAHALVELLKKV